MILLTTFIFAGVSIQPSSGITDFIPSSGPEHFKIKNLNNTLDYQISVASDSMFDDYDIGFAIYSDGKFKENDKIITVDNPGLGDEEVVFSPTFNGDHFLEVWITGDYGFVEILVYENGTTNSVTVEDYFLSSIPDLTWLWWFLGIFGGFIILMGIIAPIVIVRIAKVNKAKISDALAKGIALPRAGRKKDKCPFCNVKLPQEYQSQCPYCGAPITED